MEPIMTRTRFAQFGLAALIAVTVSGCAMMQQSRTHRANNLYQYLYSEQATHVDAPSIPVLSLPLRVGVAFVPDDSSRNYYRDAATFSETHKMELMQEVSDDFKSYPFVKSIELIPTTCLRPKGGFENLEQLRSIYGVDVVALLSYDQVQFTDEGLLSLTYWTIVGAYAMTALMVYFGSKRPGRRMPLNPVEAT
jgi:rhombotail lipoprotein